MCVCSSYPLLLWDIVEEEVERKWEPEDGMDYCKMSFGYDISDMHMNSQQLYICRKPVQYQDSQNLDTAEIDVHFQFPISYWVALVVGTCWGMENSSFVSVATDRIPCSSEGPIFICTWEALTGFGVS